MSLHLNCDSGERGPEDPIDLAVLTHVDQINLACGGHAGSPAIAADLARRADDAGVEVCLHPGYDDRVHFGRRDLDLPWPILREGLERQRDVLPQVTTCKLHGALYHRADRDADLAALLADWYVAAGIATIVAPPGGAQEAAASAAGLTIRREGFADRAYRIVDGRGVLADRSEPWAVFSDGDKAAAQVRQVVNLGRLHTRDGPLPFTCETWCVHGDTPTALDILARLRAEWPRTPRR